MLGKIRIFVMLALLFGAGHAVAQQQSSISPSLPAAGQPYSSTVVRDQFQAAISDIDRLMGLNSGASAPLTCNLAALGQAWLNTSTTPYTLSYCDGTGTWIAQDFWDVTNHIISPPTGRGECQSIVGNTTTDLGSFAQSCITITGSGATITSFGGDAKAGDIKILSFSGSTTMTYNATSLILPGAASVTTSAGDVWIFEALGSGNWVGITRNTATGVSSFNGRTGAVVPASNDYNFNQLAGTATYPQLPAGLESGSPNYVLVWNGAGSQINPISPTAFAGTLPIIAPPGSATNVNAALGSASTSVAISADGVVVCTGLAGGNCTELGNYSQTFASNTTGAGGMDTGVLPSSGFVCLYAIYSPSGPSTSILGTNCTTSSATIYAGTHMPAGYTQSALIASWPTNGTPAMVAAALAGRTISFPNVTALTESSNVSCCQQLSISSIVPPNARSIGGQLLVLCGTSPGANSTFINVGGYYVSATLVAQQSASAYCNSTASIQTENNFINLILGVSQTMYYQDVVAGTGSQTANILINQYSW